MLIFGLFQHEANFNVSPTNGGGINANDIVPATTEYTWTVVAPAFISGASDNLVQAASIFQTLVNATNTVQQVVYTVTPISTAIGECIGDSFTITRVKYFNSPFVIFLNNSF